MFRRARTRLTPASVIALVALCLALGTSSFAEPVRDAARKLISGKQIKDRSIGLRDLSKKARRKLRGKPGPAGPAGPKGDQGLPGTSIFGSTIPSGTTVRGGAVAAAAPSGTFGIETAVSLPAPAPVPLTSAAVNFPPGPAGFYADSDPSCTGTFEEPTAPAGKVCLYPIEQSGAEASGESLGAATPSRYAFRVQCSACDLDPRVLGLHGAVAP